MAFDGEQSENAVGRGQGKDFIGSISRGVAAAKHVNGIPEKHAGGAQGVKRNVADGFHPSPRFCLDVENKNDVAWKRFPIGLVAAARRPTSRCRRSIDERRNRVRSAIDPWPANLLPKPEARESVVGQRSLLKYEKNRNAT